VRRLGLLLTVLGLALVAAPAARYALDQHRSAQAQERLRDDVPQAVLRGRSAQPVARAVAPGQALAVMRIPRFGATWSWVAAEGTSAPVLAGGPGHYVGTPLPGQRGNVAFAAHRAGHGSPFLDFDRLRPGDLVELRQGSAEWTYVVDTTPHIVPTSADWVLDPLPGRRLTLTTCWPKYGSAKRMFVRAHLVRS
jgi:sortase A